MTESLRVQVLRPWLAWLDACTCPRGGFAAAALQRARRVLTVLAQGNGAAVAASITASERVLAADGAVRDLRPARALREMWCDRDAVLRLGVWAGLRQQAAPAAAAQDSVFHTLMALASCHANGAPPGVLPSREHGAGVGGFAHSSEAALFFNGRLRRTLANLAALYDGHGADFAHWLALPDYVPGQSPLEPWGRAWTAAVVATYLDWLHRASGGSLAQALELLGTDQPKRFRPPARVLRPSLQAGTPRPAVLPTADDGLHFELLLPVVLAQVMDHQAWRWDGLQSAGQRFAVALCMKTLDQGDSQRHDQTLAGVRNFTRYRGLSIVQVYMAVVAAALAPAHTPVGQSA